MIFVLIFNCMRFFMYAYYWIQTLLTCDQIMWSEYYQLKEFLSNFCPITWSIFWNIQYVLGKMMIPHFFSIMFYMCPLDQAYLYSSSIVECFVFISSTQSLNNQKCSSKISHNGSQYQKQYFCLPINIYLFFRTIFCNDCHNYYIF